MDDWLNTTLGSVLPFKYGKNLPKPSRTHTGEFQVVSSAGFVDTHFEPLTNGPTVVIGRKGSVGTVYYSAQPVFPIDTTFYVEGSSEVDIRFAYYLLKWLPLTSMNSDSAVPGLNRTHAENLEINLPSQIEQQAIAETLGALDDKIESNRFIIRTAETLGSALLQSKLDLGESGIPDRWSDQRLGAFLEVLETGSRPKGGVISGQAGPISLGAESIQSAGVMSITSFKRIPEKFADSMKRGHLEEQDVLVYKDGGRPGNFIPHVSAFGQGFPANSATINEHVYRVRSGSGISQGLLYWLLRSPWMDLEMRKRGTGVAIPGLNSSNFRDLPVPHIRLEIVEELNETLAPLLALMLRLAAVNMKLAELRDALLPELLSGRMRVPSEIGAPI